MPPVEQFILAAYLAILAVLSTYGSHRLFILWLYWRHREDEPVTAVPDERPRVTVQLPVFNERNVVERLIDAACRLDWPRDRLQVQVLDDSTDDTVDVSRRVAESWRSRGVDIEVLHRTDRRGFKAGALAAGTHRATGEFLAVFDADFIPPADFLRRVMPAFREAGAKIGMVQARWGHTNEQANLLTRLSAVLLDGHFVLEHTARHRSGRFFNFNGTAGVWRRACVEDAGGWQHDTLTEDLDLSYRAQLAGWSFTFLRDVVVPAELPDHMRAFKTQQHRWAKGTIQCARKLLPAIWRSPAPAHVKAEATAHMTANLAYPLVLLMALLMPLSVAIRGHGGLAGLLLLDLPAFLLATGSVALFYASAEREVTGSWWRKVLRIPLVMGLGIGISVQQSRAVLEGLFGRDITFVRTPKVGDGVRAYSVPASWTPIVELALALYYAGAIAWALAKGYLASLPFMLLFGGGFAYVGLGSIILRRRLRAAAATA